MTGRLPSERVVAMAWNRWTESFGTSGRFERNRHQGESKSYFRRWDWKADTIKAFGLPAEIAAHALNHKPGRCPRGLTAWRVNFGNNRIRYPKRQRKVIYSWIRDLSAEISIRAGKKVISPLA